MVISVGWRRPTRGEEDNMIPRYETEVQELWENVSKFGAWRDTEIAVLQAREEFDEIPAETTDYVRRRTWIDPVVVGVMERRDEWIRHDLNAFIEVMRLQIGGRFEVALAACNEIAARLTGEGAAPKAIEKAWNVEFKAQLDQVTCREAGLFHDGMTSYDTQEPAKGLLLRRTADIIDAALAALALALWKQASAHRGTLMVGRTHVQHAQPITFGVKCLWYLDMILRARTRFAASRLEAEVMKLAGAVGLFTTLKPRIEKRVGEILGLPPVIATQIVPLDRLAQFVNTCAEIAAVIEKIAGDLHDLTRTEIAEVCEPFAPDQKGSSAMPHKRNAIGLENIRGLCREIRAQATPTMENVDTRHERDICHSSVERMALPDAFGLLVYVLRRFAGIVDGLEVFPQRMAANLEMTRGAIASQRVEMFLKERGMPAEEAYRTVQEATKKMAGINASLPEMLLQMGVPHIRNAETKKFHPDFESCFVWRDWVQEGEDAIYEQFVVRDDFKRLPAT
ncbi:adenylosuccinate lyase [Patescibacteria group bacterium]|nr:MAG: adenylosuccinate lyase [Patescibacteria group bacterium]